MPLRVQNGQDDVLYSTDMCSYCYPHTFIGTSTLHLTLHVMYLYGLSNPLGSNRCLTFRMISIEVSDCE